MSAPYFVSHHCVKPWKMAVGCLGCCVFPHGRKSVYALALGLSAYLFLSVSMWSCVFMKVNGYLYAESPFVRTDSTDLLTSQIGLFSFQEFAEYGSGETAGNFACTSYSQTQKDEFFDGAFKMARGFAVLANITIGTGLLALTIASCAYFEIILLHWCGWLFIVGSVFEILTLVVFASDAVSDVPLNGTFWWGSALAIAASITALLAGIVTIRLPESDYEPDASSPARPALSGENTRTKNSDEMEQARPMRPGTETTEETILPDGRRKYTTTKWNKDGSKTVSEVIQ